MITFFSSLPHFSRGTYIFSQLAVFSFFISFFCFTAENGSLRKLGAVHHLFILFIFQPNFSPGLVLWKSAMNSFPMIPLLIIYIFFKILRIFKIEILPGSKTILTVFSIISPTNLDDLRREKKYSKMEFRSTLPII